MANVSKQIVPQSFVLNKHPLMFVQLPTSEGTLSNAFTIAYSHLLYYPHIPILDKRMRLFAVLFNVCFVWPSPKKGSQWPNSSPKKKTLQPLTSHDSEGLFLASWLVPLAPFLGRQSMYRRLESLSTLANQTCKRTSNATCNVSPLCLDTQGTS